MNKVCQFIHALTIVHWATVKRIMCYLKATISYSLHITHCSSLSFQGFTNANWAGGIDDHKSNGGYLMYLGNTLIS